MAFRISNFFKARHLTLRLVLATMLSFLSVILIIDAAFTGHFFTSLPPPTEKVSPHIRRAIVIPKLRREDVSWAHRLQPNWVPFIYSIDNERGYTLSLPVNRGREAMAYLSFIVDHYDSLPEVIAFVHGTNKQWHNDVLGDKTADILENLRTDTVQKKGYVNLRCSTKPGCPTSVNPLDPTDVDIKKNDVRSYLADIYMELFNVTRSEVPKHIGGVCCAQFALSKERIRVRPREDYIRMRDWAIKTKLDSFGIGWVFEKLWHVVFMEDAILCPNYNQCRCDLYGWCGPQSS